MSLLNDTYTHLADDSEAIKRKITPALFLTNDENETSPSAPKKILHPNESVFKSPFSRTLSPTTTPKTQLFKSPLRD